MEIGASVWFKDKVEGWCPSTIVKREDIAGQCKFLVRVTKPNQSTAECQVSSIKDQEVETLKLMNTPEDSEQENLINLPFLHEPALLYCLEQRYYRGLIYTYTGPILIAVNPFKTLDLYSDALLQTYYNFGLQTSRGVTKEALPPHIFAIADAAYNCMVSAVKESSSAGRVADQSILVSGESGAGKTESTKIVLRYLTTIASNSKDVKAAGSIMDKILKSNPILEALGNAKTIRNDNSSRFGKFIELNFDDDGHLVGGHIRTYLLEKVRLISQQLNERNFHIFYQMFTGEPSLVKERWQLPSMHNFNYLNQGKCFHVPDLDDKKDFTALRQAFQTLNFNPTDEGFLFDIVAGLMHLGQIQFTPVELMGEEGSAVLKDATANRSLEVAMKLLGISHKEFIRTVTERAIIARTEVYQKKLTATQASDARDSIARSVYGKLFDWVVATINTEIRGGSSYDVRSEIAVLDIFGFECLSENSFEQLCINYTNEMLQQQFNQFIFKMEQADYEAEGIEWSFVSFPDNQDCIDLIDDKKKSIFRLLDDECMLMGGSDVKFANKMAAELGECERFTVSPFQKTRSQFCIRHYAGEVIYSVTTFLEKNKDDLPRESTDLLASSTNPLLQRIFNEIYAPESLNGSFIDDESSTTSSYSPQRSLTSRESLTPDSRRGTLMRGASTLNSPTICTQFKGQLASLVRKIHSTKPHYIRCLKPNDENKSDVLNRLRTTEQLRYGGVLEAVRVARSGFPVRFTHFEFYSRYRLLADPYSPTTRKLARFLSLTEMTNKMEGATACRALVEAMWEIDVPQLDKRAESSAHTLRILRETEFWRGTLIKLDRSTVQLGKSKVFLRKQAHDLFESRRSKCIYLASRRVQSIIRAFLARMHYLSMKMASLRIQIAVRYYIAHRRFVELRRLKAALRIQTVFRRQLLHNLFRKLRSGVITVQNLFRGRAARKQLHQIRVERGSVVVQAAVRRYFAKLHFIRFLRVVLFFQCKLRMYRAKKELQLRQSKARDISTLRESNLQLKLEFEVMAMAKLAAEADRDNARKVVKSLESIQADALLSIQKLEAASHAAEMKSSAAAAKIAELEARVAMSDKLVDERTSLVAYLGKGSSDLVAQVSKLAESIKRSSGRPSINNSSTHVSSLQESLTVAMLASDPMVREAELVIKSQVSLADQAQTSDRKADSSDVMIRIETHQLLKEPQNYTLCKGEQELIFSLTQNNTLTLDMQEASKKLTEILDAEKMTSKTLEESEAIISSLRMEVATLNEAADEREALILDKQAIISDLRANNADLVRERDELILRHSQAERHNRGLMDHKDLGMREVVMKNSSLQAEICALTQQRDELLLKYTEAGSLCRSLISSMEHNELSMKETEAKIRLLQAANTDLLQQIDELMLKHSKTESHSCDLMSTMGHMKLELEEAQEKLCSTQIENYALLHQRDELLQKSTSAESYSQELLLSMEHKELNIKKAEAKFDGIQAAHVDLLRQRDELIMKCSEAESCNHSLTSVLKHKELGMNKAEAKIRSLQAELSAVVQQRNELLLKQSETESHRRELMSTVEHTGLSIKEAESKISSLQATNNNLLRQRDELILNISRAESHSFDLKSAMEHMKAELAEAHAKIRSFQAKNCALIQQSEELLQKHSSVVGLVTSQGETIEELRLKASNKEEELEALHLDLEREKGKNAIQMTLLTQKKSYGKALSLHRILVAFFTVAIMLLSYRLKILQSCGDAPESQAIDSLLDHNALQIWDHSNLDLQGHSLAASLSIDELCFQKVTECGNSAKLLIAAGKFRPLAAINGVMTNSEGIDDKTRQPTANIINESFLGRPGEFLLNLWQSINLMWRNIDL